MDWRWPQGHAVFPSSRRYGINLNHCYTEPDLGDLSCPHFPGNHRGLSPDIQEGMAMSPQPCQHVPDAGALHLLLSSIGTIVLLDLLNN
jgi:hypothetical protein